MPREPLSTEFFPPLDIKNPWAAFAIVLLLSLSVAVIPLQAAGRYTFAIETHSQTPYTPTHLGNGEVGVSSSALGTLPTECFMAGVFDHAPGDVSRIAAIPAWNGFDVYNGRSWLDESDGVRAYSQTLDMYDALLNTAYSWVEQDREIALKVKMFVSRADPAIGAVRLEITPRFSALIKVLLPLTAWPEPKRYPLARMEKLRGEAATNQWALWYPGHIEPLESHAGRNSLSMVSKAAGTGVEVAENVHLNVPQHLPGLRLSREGLSQKYAPALPPGMTRLVLHNITVRGRTRDVAIP